MADTSKNNTNQEYKKNKNYIWDFYSKGGTGNLKQD